MQILDDEQKELNHPIVVKIEQNQDYFMHLFTNLLQPQVTQELGCTLLGKPV